MKIILKILRKVLFSFLLLYTYNMIAISYNLIIPINLITISILTFLDAPGLILLVTILKIFYWG